MMKKFFIVLLYWSNFMQGQITPNMTTNFNDQNMGGWTISTTSNGGLLGYIVPFGASGTQGDYCFRFATHDPLSFGLTSVYDFYNSSSSWTGNYISTGIKKIRFDAKRYDDYVDLKVRIYKAGNNSSYITSNAAVTIGTTSWQTYTLSIEENNVSVTNGTYSDIMANVGKINITSSPQQYTANALISIDNIVALQSNLGVKDSDKTDDKTIIYVNSAQDEAVIFSPYKIHTAKLYASNGQLVKVFNIVGSTPPKLSIGNIPSGVYLVELTAENYRKALKFIKK